MYLLAFRSFTLASAMSDTDKNIYVKILLSINRYGFVCCNHAHYSIIDSKYIVQVQFIMDRPKRQVCNSSSWFGIK